jgi:hypothetical protein
MDSLKSQVTQVMDSLKSQVTQAQVMQARRSHEQVMHTQAHVQVLDYLMPNQPGLYIKWSPTNMTSKDVYDVLTELNLGLIDAVRPRPILNQQTQQEGTSFTIFMKEWFRNSNADQARLKLISDPNNFITINYEQNKYWKIYPNRINNSNNKPNPKPFQPSITFNEPPREHQQPRQTQQPREHQHRQTQQPREHQHRQTQQPRQTQQTPKKIEKMKYIPKSIQVPRETTPRETTPRETTPNTAPAEKKYSWADNNSDDEDN